MDFIEYREYVLNTLRAVDAPINLMLEQMEETCWEIVKAADIYSSDHLQNKELSQLWQVFNRLTNSGSYTDNGPIAGKQQVNWLFEEVAKILGQLKLVF